MAPFDRVVENGQSIAERRATELAEQIAETSKNVVTTATDTFRNAVDGMRRFAEERFPEAMADLSGTQRVYLSPRERQIEERFSAIPSHGEVYVAQDDAVRQAIGQFKERRTQVGNAVRKGQKGRITEGW